MIRIVLFCLLIASLLATAEEKEVVREALTAPVSSLVASSK